MEQRGSNHGKTTDGKGAISGVVKIVGQSQLPQEFITIGKNFEEALGRCVLRDDEQKNAIVIYKAQLELFSMFTEIQDLTNFLNASSAVGGFNRSLAAMTYTGIFVPEGAGIKVSKENQKALMAMQRERNWAKGKDDHREDERPPDNV